LGRLNTPSPYPLDSLEQYSEVRLILGALYQNGWFIIGSAYISHGSFELILIWQSTHYRLPDHTLKIYRSRENAKENANVGLTGTALPENVPYNERGSDKNAKHANSIYVESDIDNEVLLTLTVELFTLNWTQWKSYQIR
jgi:hypothetical protein